MHACMHAYSMNTCTPGLNKRLKQVEEYSLVGEVSLVHRGVGTQDSFDSLTPEHIRLTHKKDHCCHGYPQLNFFFFCLILSGTAEVRKVSVKKSPAISHLVNMYFANANWN